MRSKVSPVVVLSILWLYTCKLTIATPESNRANIQLPFLPTDDYSYGGEHEFTLRHIYHKGSHRYPSLHRRIDIRPNTVLAYESDGEPIPIQSSFHVRSNALTIQRLSDRRQHVVDGILKAGELQGEALSFSPEAWTVDKIPGPNVTDKETVLAFAHMAANAYVTLPRKGDWVDVGGGFNYTEDFGWETDGLRGHIFADTENKTVIIGLKGTSLAFFDGTETTDHDLLNDNLFGSCCCGQGGQYAWKKVCDCQTSTLTCDSTCLVQSLRKKSNYYHAARHLYHNVTALYPNADIWLTGHSLGGVVSALLGQTFGLPTLTYEAFPDALAAHRLGLPTPPGHRIGSQGVQHHSGIYHFGHTADPVYVGSCNEFDSACTLAGYAFESKCHTGYNCTYDTVGDLGWGVSITNHRIGVVIKDVIERYNSTPTCKRDLDCSDCGEWTYFEGNQTRTATSSSTTLAISTSRTATTTTTSTPTCLTPAWWGCRDETTTTGTTATSKV
ncbi:hypothetical protein AUEXF2481DRAFT_258680 [Aureobasidium subglaciale EXF-2481]|uniref:triacylglycerol lipase n=1 Tax=Aureobasidium subglaciale (strain EXF-2481) TaxID=1043005 RepID=A0A074YAJ1_AURSE|nr:uncharacterized protein AUEXF2481DRAFT_258680 [Aureobasidium subglaciale EXF-2481]KAI5212498.1 alpha/beta-hydrolase [Aureobasidium subglaciale]KAI5231606.1 alpha/beta-hydrolase [Aureobasidium subglaciale]KAI5234545.1 alpha/beta-hydrolase [Aureobasidium subglaciale]KAI5267899.1 alpha/beta-hydrolase [Aureobasidium subglaciale]KEQ94785.1 hypothetical protein AUEXF2481DRAFT_258680 [Aureobasidium subglaciale EXF-2481]